MHQAFDFGKNFRIAEKRWLSERVFSLLVEAPDVASAFRAGQFAIVRRDERSERVPLTIAAADPQRGLIRLVVKVSGHSTKELGTVKASDYLLDLAGPLGRPLEVVLYPRPVLAVAAGIGGAVLLPLVSALRRGGNMVHALLGAETGGELMLAGELEEVAPSLEIATEDGSAGRRGLVTELLSSRLDQGFDPALVLAAGPVEMMKAASEIALRRGVPLMASLRPLILDGTGMCGGCRVNLGEEVFYACIDGPWFDGARIDWDELLWRVKAPTASRPGPEDHPCRLDTEGGQP